jgi:hypothetical protein
VVAVDALGSLRMYVHILDDNLYSLQEVIYNSNQMTYDIVATVEDEFGKVQVKLKKCADAPNGPYGPYVITLSGVTTVLDPIQRVASSLLKIVQHAKMAMVALNQASSMANKDSTD